MRRIKTRQKIRRFLIITSALLFPLTFNFFSPYVSLTGAIQGIIAGSLITFSVMFISSLFFGRFICGWLCPGGGIGEICIAIQNKPLKSRKTDLVKYFIWVPWFSAIFFFLVKNSGKLEFNPLYLTESGTSIDEPGKFIIYYVIITILVILGLALGRRGMCHSICWMSPFMIAGRKIRNIFRWPSLQLKADSTKCIDCKKCEDNCPMSLPVNSMVRAGFMENTECILCGECRDTCPNGVIKYVFGVRES